MWMCEFWKFNIYLCVCVCLDERKMLTPHNIVCILFDFFFLRTQTFEIETVPNGVAGARAAAAATTSMVGIL